jgi:hypothetical protein
VVNDTTRLLGYGYPYNCFAIAVVALDPRLRLPSVVISRRIVPVPLGQHAGLREVWAGNEPFDRHMPGQPSADTARSAIAARCPAAPVRHVEVVAALPDVVCWKARGGRTRVRGQD